ncbi:hypothetical protein FOZ62_005222, partial [Perkinsus olseni]
GAPLWDPSYRRCCPWGSSHAGVVAPTTAAGGLYYRGNTKQFGEKGSDSIPTLNRISERELQEAAPIPTFSSSIPGKDMSFLSPSDVDDCVCVLLLSSNCRDRRRIFKTSPNSGSSGAAEGYPFQVIIHMAKTYRSLITIAWFALLSGLPP